MTTIFSDGFESGNFNQWTTTGSPSIVGSPVHHGSYAARIPLNSRVYKIFADQDIVYARAYVRWITNPSSGNQAWLFNLGNADGTGTLVYARIVNDAGTMKWGIITLNNAGNFASDLFTGGPTPTVGTWYCVELKWQKNTLNGAKLIVNGAFVGCTTATTHNSQADTLNLWLEGTEITAYYDCAVASDVYIGSEDNLEVGNNLTVNNKLTMRTPESGNYIDIQTIDIGGPILQISQAVLVKDDLDIYGFLGTVTDPEKGTGGGAIMMGHGFTSTTDEPQFILMDTISGGSGATATLSVNNGEITDVIVTNHGSNYTFADVTVNSASGSGAASSIVFSGSG
jgi:hypothetical protein